MRLFTTGKQAREASRLEMIMAFIIIGILIVVFMRQLDLIASHTEQIRVIHTLSALRQGMNNVLLKYIVERNAQGIAELGEKNPFNLVLDNSYEINKRNISVKSGELTQGYLGELERPSLDQLPGANWYYDLASGHLVYLVKNTDYFHTDLAGRPRIRVAAKLQFIDRDGDGGYTRGDGVSGIQLQVLDKTTWHEQTIR